MKRFLLITSALLLVIALVLVGCSTSQSTAQSTAPANPPKSSISPAQSTTASLPSKVTCDTTSVKGMMYAMVSGLAKVTDEHSSIQLVVAPSAGSTEWVPEMISSGHPELGCSHTLDAWWQYTGKLSPSPIPDNMLGTKPFFSPHPQLRAIAAIGRAGVGMLVRQNSSIKTFQDLKGKRLASGYVAQPSAFANVVADLMYNNMTLKDFVQVTTSGPKQGVQFLQEGRVDVTNAAFGMSQVTEADAAVGVRFVPLPADIESAGAKRMGMFPGFGPETWEPDPTFGIKEKGLYQTYPYLIVTTASLPDQVVETLLESWWNNYKELQNLSPSFKRITSPNMFVIPNTSIPYHQGAIDFYKKVGAWSSQMETIQQELLDGKYPFMQQ